MQIQTGNYFNLAQNLNVAPAADLRQAALHIPWALLQNNEYNAAVDTRKAYRDFDDHIKDLQRVASAAAAGASEPQQVGRGRGQKGARLQGVVCVAV